MQKNCLRSPVFASLIAKPSTKATLLSAKQSAYVTMDLQRKLWLQQEVHLAQLPEDFVRDFGKCHG